VQEPPLSEGHLLVLDARKDGVAILTLNRPERLNTLDHALYHALLSSLNDVARDKTARVVVLTGAGRAFCAGADTEVLHSMRDRLDLETFEELLVGGQEDRVGHHQHGQAGPGLRQRPGCWCRIQSRVGLRSANRFSPCLVFTKLCEGRIITGLRRRLPSATPRRSRASGGTSLYWRDHLS
jgi:hypothetical protein